MILEGANAAADSILKVQHRALLGKRLDEAFPAFCATDLAARLRQVAVEGGEFCVRNVSYAHAEGQFILNLSVFAMASARLAIAFHDVTAHQRMEVEREHLLAQLTQAQKLESMGRLVGGVVHDFNNLLHGIMRQTEFCRDELGPGHPVHAHLTEIASEAQRSARLVKQLLSFVSRHKSAPQRLNINDAISNMLKLLQRLLGEDIELVWLPDAAAGLVHMDPSHFDQILTNLAVNARDAIQGVGRLTIETHHVMLDERRNRAPAGCATGDYVRITLRDTGCGMDEETQKRIFEPFFSTKEAEKGSGLGLATVHRIIHENRGFITVQSACGQGTVFEVYLPRQGVADVETASSPIEAPPAAGGTETILLVEDEQIIRVTTCRILQKLGYTVLVADSPMEALRLMAEQTAPIDLLLTDVLMPGMTGRDLAAKLTAEFPGLKCLFMSGHTADTVASRGQLTKDLHFIAKPFSRDAFARKLREVLEDTGTIQGLSPTGC